MVGVGVAGLNLDHQVQVGVDFVQVGVDFDQVVVVLALAGPYPLIRVVRNEYYKHK